MVLNLEYIALHYKNLVFSFLTYVIILLFLPAYMVIDHSIMN